ncbi:hypothetical protein BGY98DRAFT_1025780, partial [Russula aff. rugulosa BPL654]
PLHTSRAGSSGYSASFLAIFFFFDSEFVFRTCTTLVQRRSRSWLRTMNIHFNLL